MRLIMQKNESSPIARSPEPVHFSLAKMPEEKMSAKLTRKIIPGERGMIGYVTLLRDCKVPAHKHESEQITLILKGALKFIFETKEITVSEGDALVVPSNMEHAAVALEDTIDIDFFAPPREDWLSGHDHYLRDKT
jgi:quercetin dioxygenase-like cupin family protein